MTGGEEALVLGHLAATMAMVGLIWFVQVVHYPLFAAVGEERFGAYEAAHAQRTAWVVGPPMALEALAAIVLVASPPPGVAPAATWVGLGLLAIVQASTVALQVPAHRALAAGFDPVTWRRLVRTNWIRTAGWSARGCVAVALVAQAGG